MDYWLVNSTNRRGPNNTSNGIPLPRWAPARASNSGTDTENFDDVVLCTGPVHIPRDAAGDWQNSALFLRRTEVSELIDFLISDDEIFRELAEKIFARANAVIKQRA